MDDWININDPLNGFIFIPKKFVKIIDTYEIQRLRRIKQLSGAPYVYPGANHTRFEHSLGVMGWVQLTLDSLIKANEVEIEQEYYDSTIIAGLCHDLGHGPFSHNFEEILLTQIGKDHEDFTREILLKSEIGEKIEDLGLNKNLIAELAIGRLNKDGYQYMDQLIAGSIDCDSRDYLARDSYHCGTNYNGVDSHRLLTLSGITPNMDLGYNIKGVATLESYLIARLNAFRTIYFHKTSRAVQIMISKAISLFNDDTQALNLKNHSEYLKWDDISLYYEMSKNEASKEIMEQIKRRELIKCVFEKPFVIDKGDNKPNISSAKLRKEIAQKARLNVEEIYIDFPLAPSVPYQHSNSLKHNEIPVFSIDSKGQKKMEKLEDYSIFFEQIKGYFNIVRVYTDKKENKQIVRDASKKILLGLTLDEWF